MIHKETDPETQRHAASRGVQDDSGEAFTYNPDKK